jgi:hypothetical protein
VSGEQNQEERQRRSSPLPKADGPLVNVSLHDGQHLYAVVRGRRREADGSWWYALQIHLPAAARVRECLVDEPAPVDFVAPAARCEPVEGQSYDQVPTERHDVAPRWRIEDLPQVAGDVRPTQIVHRGDCRTVRGTSRPATTQQARAALERDAAAPCPTCRPDRPLHVRR